MHALWRFLLPLASIIAGSASIGAAAAGAAVLSPAAIERAHIVVENLHPAQVARSLAALGVVLDPAPLFRLRGQIATAGVSVSEAKAKVALDQRLSERSAQLYHGRLISALDYARMQGELGAALNALAAAQASRAALLAEAGARWGMAMAAALDGGGDPLPQLAAGTAMLIGLSLPPG
ncbi:MAG: hypothetical protein ACREEZ_09085, partial [Stellaceae bacterium]